jgi:hypothetical protein
MLDDPLQQVQLGVLRPKAQSPLERLRRARESPRWNQRTRDGGVGGRVPRILLDAALAKCDRFREALARDKSIDLREISGFLRSLRTHRAERSRSAEIDAKMDL